MTDREFQRRVQSDISTLVRSGERSINKGRSMNGELLTVTLNSKQIREAIIAWAEVRTSVAANCAFDVKGIENGLVVQVIARKKRVRKAATA